MMSDGLAIQFCEQVASTFPLMFPFWHALLPPYALLDLLDRVIFCGGVESRQGHDSFVSWCKVLECVGAMKIG